MVHFACICIYDLSAVFSSSVTSLVRFNVRGTLTLSILQSTTVEKQILPQHFHGKIVKEAIHQHCFVYIKPFNFVNSQNNVNAILSYLVIGSHDATAKAGGLWQQEQRK